MCGQFAFDYLGIGISDLFLIRSMPDINDRFARLLTKQKLAALDREGSVATINTVKRIIDSSHENSSLKNFGSITQIKVKFSPRLLNINYISIRLIFFFFCVFLKGCLMLLITGYIILRDATKRNIFGMTLLGNLIIIILIINRLLSTCYVAFFF